jgi:hypothetical protein
MGLISDLHCAYVRVVTWRHFQCPTANTNVTTQDKLYVTVFPSQFLQSRSLHARLADVYHITFLAIIVTVGSDSTVKCNSTVFRK